MGVATTLRWRGVRFIGPEAGELADGILAAPQATEADIAAQRARVAIGQSRRPAIQSDGQKYHAATSS